MHQLWHKMQVMCKFELKHDGDGPPQNQQIKLATHHFGNKNSKDFQQLVPRRKRLVIYIITKHTYLRHERIIVQAIKQ